MNGKLLLKLARSFEVGDLLDLLNVNYSVIDIEGNYVAFNKTNQQNISKGVCKASEVDMKTWLDCVRVMQSGKISTKEEPFGDGYVLAIKKPVERDGKVIGIIVISLDITEKKLLEKERQANVVNRKVIQKLKIIASSLSHEIRTPLAGLKVGLTLMRNFFKRAINDNSQPTKSDFIQEENQVDKMLLQIDRANTLIGMQLKNMATEQIDTSKFVLCNIRDCVADAVDTYAFETDELRNVVRIGVEDGFSFVGDPILMKHVIWNLLNNALHFVKAEGKGEILITAQTQDKHHVLSFKDTAKGIAAKEAEQVFSRFYSKRTNGTGLGLNFCKLVMEAFGGDITCRGEEGQYAEFLFSFPKKSKLERNNS